MDNIPFSEIRKGLKSAKVPSKKRTLVDRVVTRVIGIEVTQIPSKSEPGKVHVIRRMPSGYLKCDCKGFLYRSHCSHIDSAMLELVSHPSPNRVPLERAKGIAYAFSVVLHDVVVCGSIRRERPTVKDIDLVLPSERMQNHIETMQKHPECDVIYAKSHGNPIYCWFKGMKVELRWAGADNWGAMVLYSTGSGDFNIKMRREAKIQGYKLNQYGLFDRRSGSYRAGTSEEGIFDALGMPYVEPEDRV